MMLRPVFLACAFILGCAETDYGDLGRHGGTVSTGGAGPSGGTGAAGSGGASSSSSSSGNGSGATTGSGGSSAGTGGGPASSSSGGTGGSPYDTPPTCSSMAMYTGGNDASMRPGAACDSCHVLLGQASGAVFDVAGTVYETAHEPDDCDGVNVSGAAVIITDANGTDTSISVNSAGNFYHNDAFGFLAFKTPLKARVVYNGKTRAMVSTITTGDCNSCHTEAGTKSAPGRIMLP